MPRPKKMRCVARMPVESFYKPKGVPLENLTGVNLTVDGLEALRLADAEGIGHDEAAEMMGVSRPTFSRMLSDARKIVAKALSNGWAIHIHGGDYTLETRGPKGPGGGKRRGRCRRKSPGDPCR